jgi:putative membrane protein
MITKFAALAAASLLATSCSGQSAPPAQETEASKQAEAAAIGDPEIAHIAYTAGVLDVAAAKQALEKTKNDEVREFAETMLRDHEAVNEQALALVKKLGVTPQDNATSKALAGQAGEKFQTLAALRGAEFDRAYAENEAGFHAAVNDALKTTLIPGAKNAELKSLLESGLSLFSAHQAHAEQLAQKLRQGKARQ